MKDHLLWILGLIALILAGFLCLRGPQVAPVAPPVSLAPPAAPGNVPPMTAAASEPPAPAAPPPPAMPASATFATQSDGKVLVEGLVRDDGGKAATLERAGMIYGNDRLIDRLVIDDKVGDLGAVVLSGEVASERIKEDIATKAGAALDSDVAVGNRMTVAVDTLQNKIDEYLAEQGVLFNANSALLTPVGRKVLDDLVPLLQTDAASKIDIHGYTDASGVAVMNQRLSEARAKVAMNYLMGKGVAPGRLTARGLGQETPVADNNTEAGRQRNRRIEFQVGGT